MLLLIHCRLHVFLRLPLYLHSTMLLLIPDWHTQLTRRMPNLHSTMLLLIPYRKLGRAFNFIIFTFHYASTYTSTRTERLKSRSLFTFHYASTYTRTLGKGVYKKTDLHSTMLLLILTCRRRKYWMQRDLHSTMLLLIPVPGSCLPGLKQFTFHYASTYTPSLDPFQITKDIYIPLCFYLY